MKNREYGKEQPYIPLGKLFKLRLPFIHYGFTLPEAIQAFVITSVSLAGTVVLMDVYGMPYELGVLVVSGNTLLYLIHPTFGDPVFPGWITPSIPLTVAWVSQFEPGPERIKGIIALQIMMGLFFIFMGASGLAKKLFSIVPKSLRGGIIFGAGLSAFLAVVNPNGRMLNNEFSTIFGTLACFVTMYSFKWLTASSKYKWMRTISNLGMVGGLVAGTIAGALAGEIHMPVIHGGFLPIQRFPELLENYTIFGLGLPPLTYFIKAIPHMFTCYIIAMGDFVVASGVTKDAAKVRPDEYIDFNEDRSNILAGVRNIMQGVFTPNPPLQGPLWAGGTFTTAERYKLGPSAMNSLFSGLGTFIIFNWIATLFMPICSLLQPITSLGFILNYVIQAFACGYMACDILNTKEARGIGIVTGIIVAVQGSSIGLIAGVILYLLLGDSTEKIVLKKSATGAEVAEVIDGK